MQSVVIIGGSGFVGRSLLKLYELDPSVELRVLSRNGGSDLKRFSGIQIIHGDITDENSLDCLIKPDSIVINLAYLSTADKQTNLNAIYSLVRKCKQIGVKRLIHCSSCSVYGAVNKCVITEETECNPKTQYEITKHEIEKCLIENISKSFELIILRPTAIFGKNGKNLVKFITSIKAGNSVLNYLRACLYWKRRMNLVSVETVAGCIKYFSEIDMVSDYEIYIVSEDDVEENDFYDIEKCIRNTLGIRGYIFPIFPLPCLMLKSILYIKNRSNINPGTIFSNKKLKQTNYVKPNDFKLSLESFVYQQCQN